jgi:orotate phosphoribosyltransferase
VLEGHFELQDQQHANYFLRFSRIAAPEQNADEMADDIHLLLGETRPTRIFGPISAGGLLVAALSRKYGTGSGFFDVYHDRPVAIRYGYELAEGDRVLLVNDMNATGTSIRRMAQLVKVDRCNAQVVGIAVFATRGEEGVTTLEGIAKTMRIPCAALVHLNMSAWPAGSCRFCDTSRARTLESISYNS